MLTNKTVAIVGGDLRQAHLANTLAEKGDRCDVYGMFLEQGVSLSRHVHRSSDLQQVLPRCDMVVFPLPVLDADGAINTPLSKRTITPDACLDYISPAAVVLAGMVPTSLHTSAQKRGLTISDYYLREEFAVMNAVPTAEGAVEIALRELPITLFQSTCLVTGYGRISKALSRLLVAFGATVRVVARSHSDLAWARIHGCEAVALSELEHSLHDVDVLFNTVPAVLLDEEMLAKLGRHCLVIDLASKPGGVDFETAKSLGLRVIWALSLPGKVAPITAGEIALGTILNILKEKEEFQ